MNAKDATIDDLVRAYIAELLRANAAQAHERRIDRAAIHILAAMLGEPVDMEALRAMAEHWVQEQVCADAPVTSQDGPGRTEGVK